MKGARKMRRSENKGEKTMTTGKLGARGTLYERVI